MKIENHILSILQLYEYAMAIGKTLDYKESCDSFIKLLLKRKNLNAAWILKHDEFAFKKTYAVPQAQQSTRIKTEGLQAILKDIDTFKLLENNEILLSSAPMHLESGNVAIYNLMEEGYLFLYSKKDNIKHQDLVQLQPVMSKFTNALKACRLFAQQQTLLKNLESRNQELSDYAHMVSHDLKSPLRSIDTLTTWISEDYRDKLDASGQNQLKEIRNSVEKMDTLIKGILDYSTIDKNQEESYDVDLNSLVKDVINSIRVPSHVTVFVEDLPKVKGDKYRLQQLFQNLIDNAIKYNEKEHGKIRVGANETEDFWEFCVEDNGKGIDSKYFNKIFKTFEKLENKKESTGIGLSIVKKIVQLYGGSIWLESELGEGTTFYFTLKK